MSEKLVIGITFGVYLLIMLGIGWYFYNRTKNLSDYVLGGRSLGSWGTSISAQASDMSGWLLLGLPGAAYATGLSGSVWMATGLAIGTYLNWKLVAQRLRISTQKYSNSITIPSYLENRFNDDSRLLRKASSIFILLFFLVYTASGFVSGGKLFQTVFGVPYKVSVIIGAVVVVAYTFLGGFMAVCWTDIIQGLLMFFTLLILPVVVLVKAGGINEVVSAIDPSLLNPFNAASITGSASSSTVLVVISIISSLAWGLGYFGQPHILARFMAIKNPDLIKKSRIIAMFWVVLSLFGATAVGLVGHSIIPDISAYGGDSETIFMLLVNNCVPLILTGILMSAILAAIMSTADSQLLVAASTVSEDFYKGMIKPKASDRELILVSRLTVLSVAIIALIIAFNPNSSVLGLVSYAWAGFGAAFGPVILLSLFYKKMTKNGAAAGMIVGGLTSVLWPLLKKVSSLAIFQLYEIVPGFLFAVLAIFIVSRIDIKNSTDPAKIEAKKAREKAKEQAAKEEKIKYEKTVVGTRKRKEASKKRRKIAGKNRAKNR
ncbi:MAG: sodium/proline symporter PutP [Clostridium sp.]|nr:sodium/proline symporter PutP [Clostridium sp.]